jgi:hypothetical protein
MGEANEYRSETCSHVNSYALLNNGAGKFTMTRANIPAGPGESMDAESGHWFLSTTLGDLNGDGLPVAGS